MKTEDKTPMESSIEDQKKQALEHYEELSKEGHHWNSFVVKAIKEYIYQMLNRSSKSKRN